MNIQAILREHLQQYFSSTYQAPAINFQIQPTNPEFEGSYTIVCFPLTKLTRKGPEETARLVGDYLVGQSGVVDKYNVVKGFLNLVMSNRVWLDLLRSIHADSSFGQKPSNGKEIMVEYSSPNTNKPLHLGHLRNNFLGWSVAEIYKACGYKVHKVQIINDRGIHICKSMLAWKLFGNGEKPTIIMKGDKLVGKYYVIFERSYRAEVATLISNHEIERPLVDYFRKYFEVNPTVEQFVFDFEIGQITLRRDGNYDGFATDLKNFLIKLFEDIPLLAHAKRKGAQVVLGWLDNLYDVPTLLYQAQLMLRLWEQKDPATVALWKTMNGWVYEGFEVTYKRMGVDFDKLYYESETYLLGKEEVLKGLEHGIFFSKEDGSVWVNLTEDGLDEKVLLRSDGTSVYMTQDIATAILRFRDFPKIEKQVYTVGNEQEYHFKVLFLILAKLGYAWAKECYHLSYGMVDLPSGRMKSREGTVVDADDLMQEMADDAARQTKELGKVDEMDEAEVSALSETIGMGALKFFLLKVDPKKRMLFDPEESIQLQGHTGPFVQYTYARIRSIIRKAATQGHVAAIDKSLTSLEPAEREVVFRISTYSDKLEEAAREYSPAVIANFAFELAKEYNQFYQSIPIFNEADKAKLLFRVALSEAVAVALKKSMSLLGIRMPERM